MAAWSKRHRLTTAIVAVGLGSFVTVGMGACSRNAEAPSDGGNEPLSGSEGGADSEGGGGSSAGDTGIAASDGGASGGNGLSFNAIRLAAGQTQGFTDPQGNAWSADTDFTGGVALLNVDQPVGNTAAPQVYDGQRYGYADGGPASFAYDFTVPAGSYIVTLKFAESFVTGPGQRLFDVAIDGQQVLDDFDIYAASGGQWLAVDRSFPVTTATGAIHVAFDPGPVQSPKVDGLEIVASGSSPPGDGGLDADTPPVDAGASPVFVPLHAYYMSPTGADGNPGTLASPWATPNHAVNCGDVIYAQPGTYTNGGDGFTIDTNAANCPSPAGAGGVDNSGQIYFAQVICANGTTPDPFACVVTAPTAAYANGFGVMANNWAISGWVVNGPSPTPTMPMPACSNGAAPCATGAEVSCFYAGSTTGVHYVAFINDIANGCGGAGFTANNTSITGGFDEVALVGDIAFNSAWGSAYGGSNVSLGYPDPTTDDIGAQTHVFVAGLFSYDGTEPIYSCPGCTSFYTSYISNQGNGIWADPYDGEGIILDTFSNAQVAGKGAFSGQTVVEQSAFWGNGSSAVEVFDNASAPMFIFNNTGYGDFPASNPATGAENPRTVGGGGGELSLYPNSTLTVAVNVFDNIFEADETSYTNSLGSGSIYPGSVIDPQSNLTESGNYFFSSASDCNSEATCITGTINGTDTYATPGLASAGSLPSSLPNCTGFPTTTACMASTLANLAPSGGAASAGYHPPTGNCTTSPTTAPTNAYDAYYPDWLLGVVPACLIWKPATVAGVTGG